MRATRDGVEEARDELGRASCVSAAEAGDAAAAVAVDVEQGMLRAVGRLKGLPDGIGADLGADGRSMLVVTVRHRRVAARKQEQSRRGCRTCSGDKADAFVCEIMGTMQIGAHRVNQPSGHLDSGIHFTASKCEARISSHVRFAGTPCQEKANQLLALMLKQDQFRAAGNCREKKRRVW